MQVITIETASLGDRSYVVHDGDVALVIDPQRDIDRVLAVAEDAGVRITHVAETHVHNDYVSGGLVLSRVTGARYLNSAAEPLYFDADPVVDGDRLDVGQLLVEVLHTPGHTPHHLSYLVRASGVSPALFTGGSLLYGTVGRTDLISSAEVDRLTRAQYRSARRLAADLPDETRVYPTHGFGSFCASAQSEGESDGTLGTERRINLALTLDDEEQFVARLVAGLTAYPRYYAQMGPHNRAGPGPVDLSPPAPVDPVELARRVHRGEWVVDLRQRRAFAAGHVTGTIGIEVGDSFSNYLGWLVPWAMPVTLLGDSPDEVAEAQRQMVRIGIDRPAGAATGAPADWSGGGELREYPVVDFAHAAGIPDLVIVDTRREDEWRAGHIAGALNLPLHQLLERLAELPATTLYVHCGSGFRASVAASLLDRAGLDVVLIDDRFGNAGAAGFSIVAGEGDRPS